MANPFALPPLNPGSDNTQVVPINPRFPGPTNGITNGQPVPDGAHTGQVGDYIKQFTIGIVDSFTNVAEHLLIYTVFAVIFVMLIFVIVSDKSPGEIIVNTGKQIGEVAPLLAE